MVNDYINLIMGLLLFVKLILQKFIGRVSLYVQDTMEAFMSDPSSSSIVDNRDCALSVEQKKSLLDLSRRRFISAAAIGGIAVAGGISARNVGAQSLSPVLESGRMGRGGTSLDLAVERKFADDAVISKPAIAKSSNQAGFAKDISRLSDLNNSNQGGQYWRYSTLITPLEDFFIRNEYPTPIAANDPRVDPRHWQLKIHGDGVERPVTLSYEDLLRLPSRSIISNMECAGNGRSLFWEQQNMLGPVNAVAGTGWGLGGVGCAEWQYVPMSAILALVGLKKTAKHCLFWSGVDGKIPGGNSDTGRPIPVSHLVRHAESIGLAYKMNGNDLLPDHGAPVRVIVPGWCGAASTKWLTEIKIASHNFWVRLNSSAHVMIGPSYKPPVPQPNDEFRGVERTGVLGQAVTWSPPRSLLTIPLTLSKQPKMPHNYPLARGEMPKTRAGTQIVRGYAWAPQWGVRQVDIRINGGRWYPVDIVDPQINNFTWRRFEFKWRPGPGEHVIESRVTDNMGYQQPATVPFNQGGFDFSAIPKFRVAVI
jgi:sulfane dehydrogenase subunit SoxC